MNQPVWRVFAYELRRNLRRKGFLFTTFGVPIIVFILFFGYRFITDLQAKNAANGGGDNTSQAADDGPSFNGIKKAGFVDLSGMFPDEGNTKAFLTRYADESAAKAALEAGDIQTYYIIPPDYVDTGDVTMVMPHLSVAQVTSAPIKQLILGELSKGVDKDLFNRLLNPVNLRSINLQRDASGQTASNFDSDFAVIYLFAIMLLLGVFMTNGYLMQTVIEEKETRLIEILISTVKPTQLLTGKILGLGVLGMMQMVVWFAALFVLGKLAVGDNNATLAALGNIAPSPDKLALILLYFAFGYLFFAGAYGMIGAISNSMQEGPQYAVVFTLPAVLPLYFLSIFITAPDGTLAVIMSIFPITAPLGMVMRISVTTVPLWQIGLSLVLLIVTDYLIIQAAGRLFRVQTLLAGQVPKLRDIPKLLRG